MFIQLATVNKADDDLIIICITEYHQLGELTTCAYFFMLSICYIFRYNDQLSALRSDLRSCKRKTALQQKQIAEQQKQIAEQQKQTLEYANRLDDYDKKNEETSRKFQTLLQVSCPVQCFIFDIKIIDLYMSL